MKRFLCAVVLSLFAFDLALDSFDSDCINEALPCQTCLCGTPVVPHAPSTATRVEPQESVTLTSALDSFASRLTDKSLFHPPRRPS